MQARREGFTLVELLVVAVMGTIVLAAVYQTVVVQQQSMRQSYAIVGTQQNVRTAMQVLTSDLHEVSATDSDITQADSVSIGYRAMRKAGVVCDSDTVSNSWVTVATLGDAFANADSVLLYSDGPSASMLDDRWVVTSVLSASPSTSCPGHPLSSTIQRLNLNPNMSSIVRPGAMTRSFVPVLYRLTDSGGEGQLVRGEGADTVALVEDLATIGNQGVRFRYWDTTRVALTSASLATQATRNTLGRIQVKVRGTAIGAGTGASREFSDSLVSNIYLRGNRKLR